MTTTSSLGLGMAAGDLGLSDQMKEETDEERKKRLQLEQQRLALGPAAQSLGLGAYGS